MSLADYGANLVSAQHYFERRVSILSTSDVRYNGVLYTINPEDQSIALKHVKCLGTEDRRTGDQAISEIENDGSAKDLTMVILDPLRQHGKLLSQKTSAKRKQHRAVSGAVYDKRKLAASEREAAASGYDYGSGAYVQYSSGVPNYRYGGHPYYGHQQAYYHQPAYDAYASNSAVYYNKVPKRVPSSSNYTSPPYQQYSSSHVSYHDRRKLPQQDHYQRTTQYSNSRYQQNYNHYQSTRRGRGSMMAGRARGGRSYGGRGRGQYSYYKNYSQPKTRGSIPKRATVTTTGFYEKPGTGAYLDRRLKGGRDVTGDFGNDFDFSTAKIEQSEEKDDKKTDLKTNGNLEAGYEPSAFFDNLKTETRKENMEKPDVVAQTKADATTFGNVAVEHQYRRPAGGKQVYHQHPVRHQPHKTAVHGGGHGNKAAFTGVLEWKKK